MKMGTSIEGSIKVEVHELNLEVTLLGGQSFRWKKQENLDYQWHGVAYGAYWMLKQDEHYLFYKAYASNSFAHDNRNQEFFNKLLQRYLRLDFDLPAQLEIWRKSHPHFDKLLPHIKAVRVLDQEPLENILSFICSQNNNIKRISTMIQWLCINYGQKIGHFGSTDVYSFPTLDSLIKGQHEVRNMPIEFNESAILNYILELFNYT